MSISTLQLLFIIAIVQIVAVASPGPDVALVVRNSLVSSRRIALWTVLGICAGNVVHISLAFFGMVALILTVPWLMWALQHIAAAYFAYLGFIAIRSGLLNRNQLTIAKGSEHGRRQLSAVNAFRMGFVTNMVNPKVIIYFSSFFAILFQQDISQFVRYLVAIELLLITVVWFSLLAMLLTIEKLQIKLAKYNYIIELIAGVVFIGFAMAMVFYR